MTPPRPTAFPLAGLALTLLLFGPPLAHHRGFSGLTLALALLPMVPILAISRLERPPVWVTHFTFPLSHLPLLILRPELAGPEVYGGLRGLFALASILIAAVLYLAHVTPSARPMTFSTPVAFALAFGLAPTAALAFAVLARDDGPEHASFALLLGPAAAFPSLRRAFSGPGPRRAPRRPRPEVLAAALVLALAAISGLILWHRWSPR